MRDRTRAAVAAATARAAQAQDRRQRLTRAADVAIANDLAQAVHEEAALRADLELMQAAVREAEAAHAAALIERDAAALDRQRCTITAPAAGVILRVAAAPGQHLSLDSGATALIAELFDPAHLIVRADVPLADAGRITPGMRVAVACDLLPGREWSGRVAGAPGAADAARNTVAIPIAFDAAPPGVRPDMLARVRFLTEATAAAPATAVLLAPKPGPRRTPYDLLLVHHQGRLVGVDARLPPALLCEAICSGHLAPFSFVERVQREVRLGTSRIDLLLTGPQGRCYVEAKSVNLVEKGIALFPDAPTARGVRHLLEIAGAAAAGVRAAVVFVIQRDDAAGLRPHVEADPLFAETLRGAASSVQVLAYRCHVSRAEVILAERVPVEL